MDHGAMRRSSSVVKQRFCKPFVGGSNPSRGTLKIHGLFGTMRLQAFFIHLKWSPKRLRTVMAIYRG
jgi:hypothetical protein